MMGHRWAMRILTWEPTPPGALEQRWSCPYCDGELLRISNADIEALAPVELDRHPGSVQAAVEAATRARAQAIEAFLLTSARLHRCPRWLQRARFRRLVRDCL